MKGLHKANGDQAGQVGKSLMLYLLPSLMVAVVTMLLLAVTAHQLLSRGADSQAQRAMEQAAGILSVGIAEEMQTRTDRLRFMASQPALGRALMSGMTDEQRQVETARLSTWLPGVLDVRLLPAGWQQPDPQDSRLPAPIGFAGIEMLRRVVETGKPAQAEVHQADTHKPYIALAVPIWHDKRVVGTLMAAYPPDSLSAQVKALEPLPGLLRLEQKVDKQQYVLSEVGSPVDSGSESPRYNHVKGTIWQVSYEAAPQYAFGLSLPPFLGFVLLGMVPLALIFVLQQRVLVRAIRHDIEGVQEQVDAIVEGRDIGMLQPRLSLMGPLRAHLGKLQLETRRERAEGGAPKAAKPKAREVSETVQIPAEVFRAYDIRGKADEQLTPAFAQRLGQAVAQQVLMAGGRKVVVGRDVRHSSPRLLHNLIEGFTRGGCDVMDLGMAPTPLVYFGQHAVGADAAVVVTGSHNPGGENGFKIVVGSDVLAGDALLALRDQMLQPAEAAARQGNCQRKDVLNEYTARIIEDVSLARPLRVVVDCGNGAAGPMALQVLESLGCDVIPLFCEPDGDFPNHHPDPSRPENLVALTHEVRAKEADLGLAFDGDGDRLGVIDNAGKQIWPDRLLMLLARDVLTRQPGGDILYDVKSTRNLGRFVLASGGRPIMCPSGHARMRARMKETGALMGGEFSGHFFIRERWYGFDDAIYAAARLLEVLSIDPRPTSGAFEEIPDSIATPECLLPLSEGENARVMELLSAQAIFDDAEVVTLDGLRVEFADGWALIRPSNTTPSLVFRFEADSEVAMQRIQARIRDWLAGAAPELSPPF